MKTFLLAGAVFAALPALTVPVAAATASFDAAPAWATPLLGADTADRRKPRVPGGSGCDDPDDLIEHPECR